MVQERRRYPRSRVLRRGTIVFHRGCSTMPCVLLDLSAAGATIKVDDWLSVPEHFELRVLHGAVRRASVRHRAGDRAGIEFTDLPGATA